MRRDHTGRSACACQHGPSGHCAAGRCDKCPHGIPLRDFETYVCGRGGVTPLAFSEPYEHRTDASATGPRLENLAMVWLTDRVCRWTCPCPHGCHTAPARPEQLDPFGAAV